MQRQSDILAAVVIGSAMDFSLRFLLVAAVAAQSYVAPALADNYFCLQQFALCTSAPCIPDPGNPKRAICTCNVEDGPNLATVACDTVKPSVDASGIRTVYSQFALKQFAQGKRTLKCPAGTPWTWCLNKPCTVDPANPGKAICACDVLRSGEWITAGGNCNATTCKTAYWSGAPLGDFKDGTDFLVKQLKLKKSPVSWCSPADARSSALQKPMPISPELTSGIIAPVPLDGCTREGIFACSEST